MILNRLTLQQTTLNYGDTMRAAWVVIAIVCTIMVEYTAGHKQGGDNYSHNKKILDNIQSVMASYGGHKGHNSHHNHHFTAFSAYLGSHVTGSHSNHRVVFDQVVTNYGNAYNHKDGVFTCPTNGVYNFDNTVLSLAGKTGHTRMVLNGDGLFFVTLAQNSSGRHVSSSMSAVLQLKKGDRVWINTYKGYAIHSHYSTFSGWLLHEL